MKRTLALTAVLGFLAIPFAVEAQDTEWNRYTLEDLGGVFIRLESNDACNMAGATPAAYEGDVSLKLTESEVGVLTQEQMLANPAMPELRVTLECASGLDGSIAYSVGLRVQQSAQMLRDTQITLPEAVTWFHTAVGMSSGASAADSIGSSLMTSIDVFVEAWSAIHAEEEGDL
ncbi:MAG TPA: hypothetical protein DEB33_04025 [Gemmatimonadetes bacterium]|nr:hypothetical protein [Gemmatimonadota bacterium]|tara:strand:+ start:2278 stop:2799 length:522 start_codon:yes stop_codon:yes gene_type:complete